jgi:hypothetical protein
MLAKAGCFYTDFRVTHQHPKSTNCLFPMIRHTAIVAVETEKASHQSVNAA